MRRREMGRLSPKCRFREETRLGFPRPSRPVAPSMFPRAARKCCSLEPHAAAVLGLCGRNPGLAAHRGASVTCLRMAQPGRPMDERSHTTENRASTLSMPMAPDPMRTGAIGIDNVDADGSRSHRIATFPAHFGIPTTGPRWSPDGKVLRFEASDFQSQLNSLWEISPDGSNLHELFPGWRTTGFLGNWTPDGKYYVFSFSKDRRSDIWATRGKLSPQLGA